MSNDWIAIISASDDLSTNEYQIAQIKYIMSFGNDFMKDYGERSQGYMDSLDFTALEMIKSKTLKDLTDEDLLMLGFKKVDHDEFDDFFCYEDLNGLKVYVNRVDDKFELRGFMLRKEKDIHSTAELLDETLMKWRLKME